MKVLLYTENYEPGGGNRYLVDFINAVPEGIDLSLASNKAGLSEGDYRSISKPFEKIELDIASAATRTRKILAHLRACSALSGFVSKALSAFQASPVIRSILLLENARGNASQFRILFEKNRWDLIVVFNGGFPGGLSCYDLIRECSSKGMKAFMSVVSMPMSRPAIENHYRDALESLAGLIVNCEAIKKAFLDKVSMSNKSIQVLHNCLYYEGERIAPRSESKHLRFGYIGRVQKEKGVFVLLDAFAKLRDLFPDSQLELVGQVYKKSEIENKIASLGLTSNVVLGGFFTGSIYEKLSTFDVFVFPSLWEGFPYAILEAMNSGLPVIASDVGGIGEAITHGDNGLLVRKGDVGELATAMISLAGSNVTRSELGKAAGQTIKTLFSPNAFRKNVESIFRVLSEANA